MKAWAWYAALTAGAAAAVGVTYVVTKKSSSPAVPSSPPPPILPPPPAPSLQQTGGGAGLTLTVSPGLSAQTVPLDVQDPVLIRLPVGAKWQSMDGAPVHDNESPISFVFYGPINHTLVWFDAGNNQYVTSYFFVLNPNTPSTNA